MSNADHCNINAGFKQLVLNLLTLQSQPVLKDSAQFKLDATTQMAKVWEEFELGPVAHSGFISQ